MTAFRVSGCGWNVTVQQKLKSANSRLAKNPLVPVLDLASTGNFPSNEQRALSHQRVPDTFRYQLQRGDTKSGT